MRPETYIWVANSPSFMILPIKQYLNRNTIIFIQEDELESLPISAVQVSIPGSQCVKELEMPWFVIVSWGWQFEYHCKESHICVILSKKHTLSLVIPFYICNILSWSSLTSTKNSCMQNMYTAISNTRKAFHITGLWQGHRWIPSQRANKTLDKGDFASYNIKADLKKIAMVQWPRALCHGFIICPWDMWLWFSNCKYHLNVFWWWMYFLWKFHQANANEACKHWWWLGAVKQQAIGTDHVLLSKSHWIVGCTRTFLGVVEQAFGVLWTGNQLF